jgi:hypothetical protein
MRLERCPRICAISAKSDLVVGIDRVLDGDTIGERVTKTPALASAEITDRCGTTVCLIQSAPWNRRDVTLRDNWMRTAARICGANNQPISAGKQRGSAQDSTRTLTAPQSEDPQGSKRGMTFQATHLTALRLDNAKKDLSPPVLPRDAFAAMHIMDSVFPGVKIREQIAGPHGTIGRSGLPA